MDTDSLLKKGEDREFIKFQSQEYDVNYKVHDGKIYKLRTKKRKRGGKTEKVRGWEKSITKTK